MNGILYLKCILFGLVLFLVVSFIKHYVIHIRELKKQDERISKLNKKEKRSKI